MNEQKKEGWWYHPDHLSKEKQMSCTIMQLLQGHAKNSRRHEWVNVIWLIENIYINIFNKLSEMFIKTVSKIQTKSLCRYMQLQQCSRTQKKKREEIVVMEFGQVFQWTNSELVRVQNWNWKHKYDDVIPLPKEKKIPDKKCI